MPAAVVAAPAAALAQPIAALPRTSTGVGRGLDSLIVQSRDAEASKAG
ncbi:MAG: hypothetical protein ACJ786_17055 [Catenulispora sp.]